MTKKTAVYPGSFDPATNGHLDIIERALDVFDEIIVGVLVNSSKKPMFTLEERVALVRKSCAHLKGVKVESFDGLLVDFLKKVNCKVIIRGLRVATDLEYEFQMSTTNNILDLSIDTVFFMPCPKYNFLTSSMVREVYSMGGELKDYVPAPVHAALKEKIK
ncbi:pantetheine-phosphate adenylyltransferase [Parelusimicrobium proximum]|uniref:pantetheine-phosphate adenylyltransferase n=1 Tax=Parelusimicrobium proximum TaxID=3228953 RepID=UPI003D182B9E